MAATALNEIQPTKSEAPAPRADTVKSAIDYFECLSILTGLLGSPITAASLREGTPDSPSGKVSLQTLVRAAERAGFSASLRHRRADKISKKNLPCMLKLRSGEPCIFYRIEKGLPQIVLPTTPKARKPVSFAELTRDHTGEVLFIKPRSSEDEEFEIEGRERPRFWFFSTIWKLWPVYGQIIVASVLVNVFTLVTPIFIMTIYDRVVPNAAFETLWALALGAVLAFGLDFIVRTARSYFVELGGKSADLMLSTKVFEQLLAMRFDAMPASAGTLVNNFNGLESVREFFTSATVTTFVDLPFVFLFIFVAFLIAGPVALVGLVAIPIVILISLLLQYPLNRAVKQSHGETAKKHGVLVESIQGLDTIKTTRAAGRAQWLWERYGFAASRTSMKARVLNNLAVNATTFVNNFAYVATIVYGVYEISEARLTVGGLVAVSILTSRGLAPLGQVAFLIMRLQQSYVALKGLDQLMLLPREDSGRSRFTGRTVRNGKIEFKNVSFAYPNSKADALNSLTIVINPGEKVGIIGRIGSGKSTVGRLLVNLYQPKSGSIMIDDTDYRQIDVASLRERIGYVAQDAFLFQGSVWDNICAGYNSADEQRVLWAATVAGVEDFVRHHPDGYKLEVGQAGKSLSGGQRESITIARALLRDPPILFFDEPTGAMDNASEAGLRARLKEVIGGKTLLLVTHRSSMLALVERLVVIDQGRIVADGPKDKVLEVLAKGGIRDST